VSQLISCFLLLIGKTIAHMTGMAPLYALHQTKSTCENVESPT